MAAFPSYARLGFQGLQFERDSGVERTAKESGPAKQLKIRSRVLIGRQVVYFLDTLADYNNFITWFTTTINRGADWFDWTDPVDSQVKLARIRGGEIQEIPRRKMLDQWRVQFVIETWDG